MCIQSGGRPPERCSRAFPPLSRPGEEGGGVCVYNVGNFYNMVWSVSKDRFERFCTRESTCKEGQEEETVFLPRKTSYEAMKRGKRKREREGGREGGREYFGVPCLSCFSSTPVQIFSSPGGQLRQRKDN